MLDPTSYLATKKVLFSDSHGYKVTQIQYLLNHQSMICYQFEIAFCAFVSRRKSFSEMISCSFGVLFICFSHEPNRTVCNEKRSWWVTAFLVRTHSNVLKVLSRVCNLPQINSHIFEASTQTKVLPKII